MSAHPCILQQDATDCGAAALASIAAHYGLKVGIGRIRELVGTDREGSNMLGLVKGAEAIGFSASGARGDWDGLKEAPLPAICHVVTERGLGHFVVVYELKKEHAVVADPARGLLNMEKAAFCERWTGFAVLLTPASLRPQTVGATRLQFLASLLAPHRGILLGALVCAVFFTVLGLGTSLFVQHLVDSILVHARTKLLDLAGIGMLILLVFRALFSVVRSWLVIDVARKIDLTMIACYMRHVLRMPMRFFEMRRVGEILSRVGDAVKIRTAISSAVVTTIVDGAMVVAASIAMLTCDLPLALACMAFLPIFVLAVVLLRRPLARRQRASMERMADVEAELVEGIGGIETIKAFCGEARRTGRCETMLVRLMRALTGVDKLGIGFETLTFVAAGAGTLTVLWYGGHRVIEGHLTVGELMFFYTLAGLLFGPLERLASVTVTMQDAAVAFDRLWEILSLELEQPQQPPASSSSEGPVRTLRLEQVSFRYGYREDTLRDIDLDIPVGKVLAIVGESGSGKSTLCKLLASFHQPTGGRIEVNGIDLRDLPLDSWRGRIGYVGQEPHVFSGTIAENIAFGRPSASLEDIVRAATIAGLDAFIESLPQRYQTVLGERGANLSGGQRQRLAIARAIVQDPEILLLDEATSHLDTRTEQQLQRSLSQVFGQRTVVIIAHRLSTIRNADRICVLDKGRIAEEGDHARLVAARGLYAALWQAQTGDALPALPRPVRSPARANGAIRPTRVFRYDEETSDAARTA